MANSNNIASYLILCSLSNGSKYGLEIIESISARTGGHYIMKKPTLYSALTRMEKKGLVSSSFWQTSDMGGKRHYYTITSAGKKELETLEVEFAGETFDDFDDASVSKENSDTISSNDSPIVGWQDSLFNMTKTEEKPQEKADVSKQSDVVENQMDMFSVPPTSVQPKEDESQQKENQQKMEYYQSILEQQPTYAEQEPASQDDGVFLPEEQRISAQQEEQNQRLYSTSNDLKKYRKHKSFAENQIEMSVEYETEDDREIQRERIENLKNSLLNFKQHQNETIKTQEPTVQEKMPAQNPMQPTLETQEHVDDAVFITSRYNENEIPVQKKITPPNIDIDVTDDNLPAPKRNTNLEPTYKDLMARLFERKKEKEKQKSENISNAATQTQTNEASRSNISYESSNVGSFVDYNSLQKYYAERGIGFKEYKKTSAQHNHNTNFLQFISSVVLLFLSGVGCAAIFGIVAWAKLLNSSTNFLFYTIPCIFLLYTIFAFARDRIYPSKKASLTYNAVINWAVFLLSLVVIVVANVICGMQYEIFGQFLTSLLVPAYAMLLAFPCNYYIKKFLYKRYAR